MMSDIHRFYWACAQVIKRTGLFTPYVTTVKEGYGRYHQTSGGELRRLGYCEFECDFLLCTRLFRLTASYAKEVHVADKVRFDDILCRLYLLVLQTPVPPPDEE